MANFAACSWPLFRVDDFTTCFRQDYLQTLLPLAAIVLSLLTLISRTIPCCVARIRRRRGYQLLPDHDREAAGDRDDDGDGDGDGDSPTVAGSHMDLSSDPMYKAGVRHDSDGLMLNCGRLGLVKTTNNGGTIIQADAPPGRAILNVVEELAVAGLVAINAVAFVIEAHDQTYYSEVAAIAGVAVWSYTLALTTLKLFLGDTSWRVARLWNHTAALYAVQWLVGIVLFRSVFVHPPARRLEQILVIADFALTSLLFLITILVRKGNRVVLLEWENGIPPSREALASLWDRMTFAWVDPLIYAGWKAPLEMSTVWNLQPKDKAASTLARWRAQAKGSTLRNKLLYFFSGRLAAQIAWSAVAGALAFIPTLLLKAILEYIEQPDKAPKNVLWLFIILLPVSDMVRSFCVNQALWIGRKTCVNTRAILIGEIYAKALRRMAAAGKDKDMMDKSKSQGPGEDGAAPKGLVARLKRALGFKSGNNNNNNNNQQDQGGDATKADNKKKGEKGNDDEQSNAGTIINLMSIDSLKVAEVTAYLHMVCAEAPVMLVVAIVLLWQVMGWAAIPGLIVIMLMGPINLLVAKSLGKTQEAVMGATDKRIHVTNELLANIRIVKYFAWEDRFAKVVDEKRSFELARLWIRYMVWVVAVVVWNMVPIIITFFSFMVYTFVLGNQLYPSVAFTAVSLFYLLRTPLDQFGDMIAYIQESLVSIDRIDSFLSEEETEKTEQLGNDNIDPQTGERALGFRDATFIWSGREAIAKDGPLAFRLMDLNIDFKIGKLNVVTGPTGCGKSSLLSALLGEMTILKGRVLCPGGRSREEVRPDPETGLAETCAYVAQQAWLVNGSIKENILFAAEHDEDRYASVVIACGLENDMEIFDDGDATMVGENGISLSGGQKQRISLARAVYSNSRHLLLDDCLSAVDSHTAKWIFDNCIMGPLMRDRTCILVSHNIGLTTPYADLVVTMENGRVTGQGTSRELVAAGRLDRDILDEASPGSGHVSRVPSRVPSIIGTEAAAINEADNAAAGSNANATANAKSGKFRGAYKSVGKDKRDVMAEDKATGSVKWDVMKLYLGSMGGWLFWVVAISIYIGQQISIVGTNLWIKEWSNQYNKANLSSSSSSSPPHGVGVFYMDTGALSMPGPVGAGSRTPLYGASSLSSGFHIGGPGVGNSTAAAAAADHGTSPVVDAPPEVNVVYYLSVLALIGIAGVVLVALRDVWTFAGSLRASRSLHDRLMTAVTRAKFKFFDVTPLGQMMNRFSRDLEEVDQSVAPTAIALIGNVMSVLITFAIITVLLPGFVVAAVFISVLYYLLATFYLHASRDLKRLESIARSPVFQQFGETLQGIMTIRAYADERRFIRKNMESINLQLRPFLYIWASNRWLGFRADAIGNLVALATGGIIAMRLDSMDSGSAGLCLTYALGFAESVLWFVRFYASNERNMNAVERIKDYLEVEQEAAAVIADSRPPADWPARGAVEFVDYSTRYRSELGRVLRDVTLRIEPGEKVGIVGRTGAGKSSLTLAIFRALEADGGRILIDGIDVSRIGLQDLREAVTLVPQDPTLFMGTIRSNLDPFDMYTDEEIFTVLRRVQLIGPDELLASASQQQQQQQQPADGNAAGGSAAAAAAAQDAALTATNTNIFLDLWSPVTASGQNLAQGQRQLLCLARAMLRRPRVLVMDEATASIDYATDSKIQETIRDRLPGTTIITIAHRLKTIADYDKVVVLDRGRLVECGHPWELLQARKSAEVSAAAEGSAPAPGSGSGAGSDSEDNNSSGSSTRNGSADEQEAAVAAKRGTFRAMCEMSGDFDKLAAVAKAAFRAKGLELIDVDVDEEVDEAAAKAAAAAAGEAQAQAPPLVRIDSPRDGDGECGVMTEGIDG